MVWGGHDRVRNIKTNSVNRYFRVDWDRLLIEDSNIINDIYRGTLPHSVTYILDSLQVPCRQLSVRAAEGCYPAGKEKHCYSNRSTDT